jgi:hypothetical protein
MKQYLKRGAKVCLLAIGLAGTLYSAQVLGFTQCGSCKTVNSNTYAAYGFELQSNPQACNGYNITTQNNLVWMNAAMLDDGWRLSCRMTHPNGFDLSWAYDGARNMQGCTGQVSPCQGSGGFYAIIPNASNMATVYARLENSHIDRSCPVSSGRGINAPQYDLTNTDVDPDNLIYGDCSNPYRIMAF